MENPDFALWAIRRIWRVLCWCWFTVFHLALLVALLGWWWWTGTRPQQVAAWCAWALHTWPAMALAFLGVGALALGVLYAKLWQKAFRWLVRTLRVLGAP